MSTHNICFHGEIRRIFTGYPPLSRPVHMHVEKSDTCSRREISAQADQRDLTRECGWGLG